MPCMPSILLRKIKPPIPHSQGGSLVNQRLVLSFVTLLITACLVLSLAAMALVVVIGLGG